MKIKKALRLMSATTFLFFLVACSSGINSPVEKPSMIEFEKNPEVVEQEYLAKKELANRYLEMFFKGGEQVCNDEKTLCKTWDPRMKKVAIWFKDKEAMGMNSKLVGVYPTDETGVPLPVSEPEMATSADQAGIGREVLAHFMGLAQSGVSGAWAAKISTDSCGDEGCGGGGSVAIASSGSRSDAKNDTQVITSAAY